MILGRCRTWKNCSWTRITWLSFQLALDIWSRMSANFHFWLRKKACRHPKQQSLQSADLCLNQIEKLPENLDQLQSLELLNLSKNFLEELPDSIGTLKKLSILKVDQNKLLSVTPYIGKSRLLEFHTCHFWHSLTISMSLYQRSLSELDGTLSQWKPIRRNTAGNWSTF